MPTLCVSDLHLHDDEQLYLFTEGKERIFCALAEELEAQKGQLLLCGDILDLTGMNPPEKWLAEFFEAVEQKGARHARHRTVAERVVATHARFPKFFAALRSFAASGRLALLPGNHDCELLSDEGREAMAGAIGVSIEQIAFRGDVVLDGGVTIFNHGNEFDPANVTHGSRWQNQGAALTAVLYQALTPALVGMGVEPRYAQAVPAVRPEEHVVKGIEQLVGTERVARLLVAFVRLLHENGYFQRASLVERVITNFDWATEAFISPQRVQDALRDEGSIKDQLAQKAEVVRARANPPPKVVVMGHTHDFDGRSKSYVNLGTWIDHMTGLTDGEIDARDQSLPVLRVDETSSAVYDVRTLFDNRTLTSCPQLWSGA